MTLPIRLGFIGAGNIASALIGGLTGPASQPAHIVVVETDPATRERAVIAHGVEAYAHPVAALANCDAVIFAIKPQQFSGAARAAALHLGNALIISVAAGIRTDDIARWLGRSNPIVRAMPNMPALIGAGMAGLYATPSASEAERNLAQTILASVGQTLWVKREEQLDAITAVSGSGPAYVFYFIEALARAARELGFDDADAERLALATFVGATQLAANSLEAIPVLRARVTSPGGTTQAALASMSADGVADAIVRATRAACRRSTELGEESSRI